VSGSRLRFPEVVVNAVRSGELDRCGRAAWRSSSAFRAMQPLKAVVASKGVPMRAGRAGTAAPADNRRTKHTLLAGI